MKNKDLVQTLYNNGKITLYLESSSYNNVQLKKVIDEAILENQKLK